MNRKFILDKHLSKKIIICSLFLIIFNINMNITEARQGCCSHHGGVCGCECCDGSSLSATCAPYYPECSGGSDFYNPSPKIKYTAPNQATQNLNKPDIYPWFLTCK